MKIDFKKDLETVNRTLTKLSNLGALSVFLLNIVFVLLLAAIYQSWKGMRPAVSSFVQVAIIVFAFTSLIFAFYVYLTYKRVDRPIISKEINEDERNNNLNGGEKNHKIGPED